MSLVRVEDRVMEVDLEEPNPPTGEGKDFVVDIDVDEEEAGHHQHFVSSFNGLGIGPMPSSSAQIFQVTTMPQSALVLLESEVGTSEQYTINVVINEENDEGGDSSVARPVLLGEPVMVDRALEVDDNDQEIEMQSKHVSIVIDQVVAFQTNKFMQTMIEEEEDEVMSMNQMVREQEELKIEGDYNSDSSSTGDEDEDSDYDYEKDEEYEVNDKRKRGQASTSRGRGRPRGGGRGRGGSRKSERPNPLNTQSYKKRQNDPSELCPPPPPKKLRGGRRTMMKEALPPDLPEGDVQLAALGLMGTGITVPADFRRPLIPYRGTVFTTMQRVIHIFDSNQAFRHSIYASENQAVQRGVSSDIFLKTLSDAKTRKPYRLMSSCLIPEHFVYVIRCVIEGRKLDCKYWLKELGREFKVNPRFSGLQFGVMNQIDPQQRNWDDVIHCDSFAQELNNMKATAETKIQQLKLLARRLCDSLSKSNAIVKEALKKKSRIMDRYEDIFLDLSNRDAKLDEMSITGIRCIKMMMESPYFKTEDGLLSFQLPVDNAPWNMRALPFYSEKQKWTSKDLKALKQTIKDCVLAKRIDDVNVRYFELLNESDKRRIEEMSQEGKPLDVIYQAPQKRKRGRPTKEETSQRDKYGVVYPVMYRSPRIILAYGIQPKQLSDWRTVLEKRLRNMSFDTLMKEPNTEALIDWNDVSLKLMIRTKKLRSDSDCRLTYKHEVDPKVNSKRFTTEETKKIKELREVQKLGWDEIRNRLNNQAVSNDRGSEEQQPLTSPFHTQYQCFTRYVSRIAPPAKPEWDDDMDKIVKTGLMKFPAHWRKVAAMVNNEAVTKKVVVERYKKAITPMLKTGPFSRVEDCLLLLTIVRLKDFISEEGHFGSLLAYLPWRYETTWRDRAHNIFNDWIVPWTLDEDRLLLELADKMNRNWQKISEQFTSFKNRKGCLTRYKILQRNLGEDEEEREKKYSSLEEYHEAYAMTRYNVFQYRHLKEILTLLKKVKNANLSDTAQVLLDRNRDMPPSETELRCMLVVYDGSVLSDTIVGLEKYIRGRDMYWEIWKENSGGRKSTFDRRTFHPDNPQSVASAIHIRGLELKPKEDFDNLNDFEEEIYVHYGRFRRTKPLKEGTERPYLPPQSFFLKWTSVQRIIEDPPSGVMDDGNKSFSKKWTQLLDMTEKKKKNSAKNKEEVDENEDIETDIETESDSD